MFIRIITVGLKVNLSFASVNILVEVPMRLKLFIPGDVWGFLSLLFIGSPVNYGSLLPD